MLVTGNPPESVELFGLQRAQTPPEQGHYLHYDGERLELVEVDEPARVWVDFIGGAQGHRRRYGGGAGQPVARAVGIKGQNRPTVLDATAGQARDAFVLASLGCNVTLLERSPLACALVADGLVRAARDADTADIVARMTLIHVDAADFLTTTEERWDVVVLDPMFPEPDKRARSKKDMAAFQTLIGGDEDADALLEPARRVARNRVIVKRPRHAPHLAGVKPSFVFDGSSTRFDGYTPQT
ncbi:class I SAM-dependent methyltransferase [Chitinibacteraceae bacterium HSL-7]